MFKEYLEVDKICSVIYDDNIESAGGFISNIRVSNQDASQTKYVFEGCAQGLSRFIDLEVIQNAIEVDNGQSWINARGDWGNDVETNMLGDLDEAVNVLNLEEDDVITVLYPAKLYGLIRDPIERSIECCGRNYNEATTNGLISLLPIKDLNYMGSVAIVKNKPFNVKYNLSVTQNTLVTNLNLKVEFKSRLDINDKYSFIGINDVCERSKYPPSTYSSV